MVEHNLAMVRVASSNLVSRSKGRVSKAVIQRIANSYSPVRLWNAPPQTSRPGGEIGRHKGLKIPRTLKVRTGSTPVPGTTSPLFRHLSFLTKPNNFYSFDLLSLRNQEFSNFYQNCELYHKSDKKFCNFKFEDPSNNPKSTLGNEKTSLISYCGSLNKSQLNCDLSPTKKLFLSFLTQLCSSKFAKANAYSINLSDQSLSLRYPIFSPRQVQRHLDSLEKSGLIKIKYLDNKRWISIPDLSLDKGKIPIVYISSSKFTLTASQSLVLSRLLDKAAFYARSGLDFVTDCSQMRSLQKDLYPMSERTIRAALQDLKKYGLISYVGDKDNRSVLMPVVFDRKLTGEYQNKFKVIPTAKCQEIVKNRALRQLQIRKGSAGVVNSDPSCAAKANPQAASAKNTSTELSRECIKNILIFQKDAMLAKNDANQFEVLAKKGNLPGDPSAKKDSPLYVNKHDQVEKHFVYKHAEGGKNISIRQGILRLNSSGLYVIGDPHDPDNYCEFTCGSPLEIYLNGIWVPTRFEWGDSGYYLVGLNNLDINGLKARRNA